MMFSWWFVFGKFPFKGNLFVKSIVKVYSNQYMHSSPLGARGQ